MAASNLSFVFDEECTSSIVQQVCKVKDGINDLDLIKELLPRVIRAAVIIRESKAEIVNHNFILRNGIGRGRWVKCEKYNDKRNFVFLT